VRKLFHVKYFYATKSEQNTQGNQTRKADVWTDFYSLQFD